MRGAIDYKGHLGRRQVVYRSLEHDDEEEEGGAERRAKETPSTSHSDLIAALGAAVILLLLALGGTYLYTRSEGKSLSDLISSSAAESKIKSSFVSTATSPSNNLTSTSAQTASSASNSPATTTSLEIEKGSQEESTGTRTSTTSVSTSSISKPTGHSTTETATSSTSTSSTTSSSGESDSYWKKTYTGVGTHFPGASSALACGDVYSSPSTTLFAALCHSLYDSPPGVSDDDVENQNRNIVCGDFVAGRKDLEGKWVGEESKDWVVVGGDGALNCVGTEDVRCHVPRSISVTYNGVTVSGVMIVDRNQGLDPSPCDEGDVDLSDLAYLTLGETDVLSSGLKGVTWVWE